MSVTTKRYYPRLSNVVSLDDLPDFLDFAKDNLSGLLGNIYYKNLQYSKSSPLAGASMSGKSLSVKANVPNLICISQNILNAGFWPNSSYGQLRAMALSIRQDHLKYRNSQLCSSHIEGFWFCGNSVSKKASDEN